MNSVDTRPEPAAESLPIVRARANPLLAIARLAIFSGWTAWCYTACRVSRLRASGRAARRATSAYWTHRWLHTGARLAGIRINVHGAIPDGPALVTPNHMGYLDILAVGYACPTVFVSKADVRAWPVVGHLFDMSEHIGVTRSDRRSLSEVNASIAERLRNGQRVCVFLEGTSSSGAGLLPFHASLAQPAVDTGAPLVPVGLAWGADSDEISVAEDIAYWRQEHNFVTHAWHALGLRGIRVNVHFGDPIPAGADRKVLAAKVRESVWELLERDNAGR